MRNTLIAVVFISGLLAAQQERNSAEISRERRMAARDAAIDGRLGFDMQSQYFFRGILQEDQGAIFQPWLELGFDVIDSDEGLQDLRVVFGQWNSLHSGPSGSSNGIWYESRFFLGVEGQIADRWHFGTRFNTYTGPNGFTPAPMTVPGLTAPVQEIAFYGSLDDNGVFDTLERGLQPSVLIAFELDNQRDGGADEGIYAEVSISPAIAIGHLGAEEIILTVPTTLGFSLGDYYERTTVGGGDDFFGFLQVGGVISAELDFIPARVGPWEAHAGLHLIVLGDNNEARNGGDPVELFFEFGMSTTF